jgi:hypothetical protein
MSKRTTLTPFSGIVVTLAALAFSTVSGNEVQGADECLAAPNRDAAAGMQWYYFLDRAHQRKCWYQDAAGKKIHRSSNPAPQPATSKSTTTSDGATSNAQRPEPRPADRLRFNTVNPAGIDSFAMRWPGRPARYDAADPKPAPPIRTESTAGTAAFATDPWPTFVLAASETTAPSTVGQARAEPSPPALVAQPAAGNPPVAGSEDTLRRSFGLLAAALVLACGILAAVAKYSLSLWRTRGADQQSRIDRRRRSSALLQTFEHPASARMRLDAKTPPIYFDRQAWPIAPDADLGMRSGDFNSSALVPAVSSATEQPDAGAPSHELEQTLQYLLKGWSRNAA